MPLEQHWVAPFGNPRIIGHLHLTAAYRSLSRPSSPPRAKAFPLRSYLLLLYYFSKNRIDNSRFSFVSLLNYLLLIRVSSQYVKDRNVGFKKKLKPTRIIEFCGE